MEQPTAIPPRTLAYLIRKHCVEMTGKANASHVGSSLSMADLLAVLYARTLRYIPSQPQWKDRDRFILSKGHGCAALYAVLAECGYFPLDQLESFYQNGTRLAGHTMHDISGVELSAGSLGHGLPVATGLALSARRDGKPFRVFCMMSDGECDEGSVWEAALFAPQHKLDNLVVMIDYNKIQSLGRVADVINLEPLADKWRAFGWGVREIDGHDLGLLEQTFDALPFGAGRPSCIVAHTVKGKGVGYMEDKLLWHYRAPRGQDLEIALADLEKTR